MPYILQQDRDEARAAPRTPGELNYALTCVIRNYIRCMGGVSYKNLNDCVGALECAKLELYRRVAAPYEDRKCNENGDVYPGEPTP